MKRIGSKLATAVLVLTAVVLMIAAARANAQQAAGTASSQQTTSPSSMVCSEMPQDQSRDALCEADRDDSSSLWPVPKVIPASEPADASEAERGEQVASERKATAEPKPTENASVPAAVPERVDVTAEATQKAEAVVSVNPPVPTGTPAPEYSGNGWHPESAIHDHGTGDNSGVCPACGLIYGPAGGAEGQYTEQDGLMD